MTQAARRRALFIDRDGTLNVEVNYLNHPDQLTLIPGAAAAIRFAQRQGWAIVVVTNQSGVARGYLTLERLAAVHRRLEELLAAEDVQLDGLYFCPHHPDDRCRCRKPQPGMIESAAADLTIDLAASWMIGDLASDIELGRRAGCQTALVLTGHGAETNAMGANQTLTATDLGDAIRRILEQDVVR